MNSCSFNSLLHLVNHDRVIVGSWKWQASFLMRGSTALTSVCCTHRLKLNLCQCVRNLAVPITTRYPLPNVQFEMHNVNEPFRWADNTMDFVHARANDMAVSVPAAYNLFLSIKSKHLQVSDYPAMLGEAARVLRPGGLFLSGEWERGPKFANPIWGNDSSIPATHRLLNRVDAVLFANHGLVPVASRIPNWLAESDQFQDITVERHFLPIGDWHPDPGMKALGEDFRDIWVRYADSLKPVLREPNLGLNEAQIDELVAGFEDDMHTVPGMVGVYHTVHAIKV